jgi:hypothetical protein
MEVVPAVHSLVRWLIVIVGILAAIKFWRGWRRGGVFAGTDRALLFAFTGLMDIQVLIGAVYLFGSGFRSERLAHALVMFLATLVAHLSALWKKAEDVKRFRLSLFIVLDTFVVIIFGLLYLPK